MPSSPCELTILIPCLDEAATIGTCVDKGRRFLDRHAIDGEVLVADNGSADGSVNLAEAAGARVIDVAERGYGSALLAGIAAARGEYVIMGDADDSYDFSSLHPFVEGLRQGNDLVIGNRFRGGIDDRAMPFLHRYLGNPILSFLGRLFFGSPVRDFHCGLRGFNRASIERLCLSAPGMEFASEMIVRATLHGFRISEVPTRLHPDGRGRPPHLRRWRDGWRHLRFLLLFSPRWLFLYPGTLLVVLGLASMTRLLVGPLELGAIRLDVNTLVYSGAAITIGFQLVTFGLFAKAYAIERGFYPHDPLLAKLGSTLTLEAGILSGVVLFAIGLLTSIYAVGFWGRASFGDLDPQVSLRIVVPAVTAIVLGIQIASSSFFLSLLGLGGRRA